MKLIQLTKGYFAKVDDEDYQELSKLKWFFHIGIGKKVKYARTIFTVSTNKRSTTSMHRFIMKAKKGQIIDHIDGDGLNNQKSNLRFVTNSQNCMNRGAISKSKTGFRGVTVKVNKDGSLMYIANVYVKRKNIYLGTFKTGIEAAEAYNKVVVKYRGKFAVLNKFTKMQDNYCDTQIDVINRMGTKLNIPSEIPINYNALEPSSGTGLIIKTLFTNIKTVDFCEINHARAEKTITNTGATFRDWDFLKYPIENKYNLVVSVPPYINNEWMSHTYKQFKHLKNGGKMVTLLPVSSLSNDEFQKWLKLNEATITFINDNACDYEIDTFILEIVNNEK